MRKIGDRLKAYTRLFQSPTTLQHELFPFEFFSGKAAAGKFWKKRE